MGSLGPTHLTLLLVAVILATVGGFVGSAVVVRRKRRARRYFLLGFACGFIAGLTLHRRRRVLNDLTAVARRAHLLRGAVSLIRRNEARLRQRGAAT
jgi:uncharacterized membrane protein YfcA